MLEGQWLVASLNGGRAVLFYVLVAMHAISALVGFGSIGFAGTYASRAFLPARDALPGPPEPATRPPEQLRQAGTELTEQDEESEELLRYLQKPARLWPALVAVPFFGLGALAANPDIGGLDQAWVLGALLVWLSATLIAASLIVPALWQMRAMLFGRDRPTDEPGREAERIRFARAATLAGRGAACCDVLFFVALALMIWQP